jgi:hypothetical protein
MWTFMAIWLDTREPDHQNTSQLLVKQAPQPSVSRTENAAIPLIMASPDHVDEVVSHPVTNQSHSRSPATYDLKQNYTEAVDIVLLACPAMVRICWVDVARRPTDIVR